VGRKFPHKVDPFKMSLNEQTKQPVAAGRIEKLNQRRKKVALPPLKCYPIQGVGIIPLATRYNPDAAFLATRSLDDVFHYLLNLGIPQTAYVCGAGPNLLRDLERIPKNSFVIATNRVIAVNYPWSMWMVFDKGALKYDWFNKAAIPEKCLTVFGIGLARSQTLHKVDYTFRSRGIRPDRKGLDGEDNINLVKGGIQGNGTITYCATQLCYWAGCKRVILAGCNMGGRQHYDGTTILNAKKGAWRQVRVWRRALPQMATKEMYVDSLSPTAIPVRRLV